MKYFICIILFIIGLFTGIIIHIQAQKRKKTRQEKLKEFQTNSIVFTDEDMKSLIIEWETTIKTQMHFNDLIIKFRSIVLSVFIAALGFIYELTKQKDISDNEFLALLILAGIFWGCAFLLDYFYYHKLLLGAVFHAEKFDNNLQFVKKGLFGLTKRINIEIEANTSKTLIWLFYLLPILCLLVVIFFKKYNF